MKVFRPIAASAAVMLAGSAFFVLGFGEATAHGGCDQVGTEFYGDVHDNTCNGGNQGNNMFAYGGADVFDGGEGHDFLDMDAGNDFAIGGLGDDILRGDSGDDILRGEGGQDTITDTLDNGDDFDRVCVGDGQGEHVDVRDGDGMDIIVVTRPWVLDLAKDANDEIRERASCPW